MVAEKGNYMHRLIDALLEILVSIGKKFEITVKAVYHHRTATIPNHCIEAGPHPQHLRINAPAIDIAHQNPRGLMAIQQVQIGHIPIGQVEFNTGASPR